MSGYVTIFRTVYCATNAHVLLLKIQSVLKIIQYPAENISKWQFEYISKGIMKLVCSLH